MGVFGHRRCRDRHGHSGVAKSAGERARRPLLAGLVLRGHALAVYAAPSLCGRIVGAVSGDRVPACSA
ncbi:hypothetical protein ACRAWF_16365 [Streptomyces sp. L7]